MKKTILLFRKYRNALRLHILLPADAQNTIISRENGMQCVAELKKQNEAASKGMAEAFTKVMTLEEHSRKISGILNTISEISSRTELLALNASIEAACAGEHGRGVAVVAESIGKPAADSTSAASDIEKLFLNYAAIFQIRLKILIPSALECPNRHRRHEKYRRQFPISADWRKKQKNLWGIWKNSSGRCIHATA